MDFLGIGPLELIFILLIALLVFGPNDLVKAGRTLGRFMRRVVTSSLWKEVTRLRYLPNQLMREAGLEEDLQEINKGLDSLRKPPPIFKDIKNEIEEAKEAFPEWTNLGPEVTETHSKPKTISAAKMALPEPTQSEANTISQPGDQPDENALADSD